MPAELSVARTVKLKVPPAVGVPDSTPVAVSRVKPAGKAPLLTAYAYGALPFAAATVRL